MKNECVNKTKQGRRCANLSARTAWTAGLDLIREKAGSNKALAQIVGLSRQAPPKWEVSGVPYEHVFAFEEALGVPAYEIDPIRYPPERILRWAGQILSSKKV